MLKFSKTSNKKKIHSILKNYYFDKKLKIYKTQITAKKQLKEIELRKKVAKRNYVDHLNEISKYHSVDVMDNEIRFFLEKVPKNSLVCDLGGGWAWHWRNINKTRPDIKIFIVDFVIENFEIAKFFIGKNLNKNVYLINDDICNLKIKSNIFDSVWSVQTFQHIPDYTKAVKNTYRILKDGGTFFDYNLNENQIVKFIRNIMGKQYMIKGTTHLFYLNRSISSKIKIIKKIFKNNVHFRYSEILFHPDLKIYFSGKKNNFLGKIDSYLSGFESYKKRFARQICFIVNKKLNSS
jgi:ubiquinone/menaquinone biosynthesis C-methylase UbiE